MRQSTATPAHEIDVSANTPSVFTARACQRAVPACTDRPTTPLALAMVGLLILYHPCPSWLVTPKLLDENSAGPWPWLEPLSWDDVQMDWSGRDSGQSMLNWCTHMNPAQTDVTQYASKLYRVFWISLLPGQTVTTLVIHKSSLVLQH